MRKKILPSIIIIVLSLVILSLLTVLVMPKYSEHLVEGGMVKDYYASSKNHEVIFIGDCEAYANISPMVLFEKQGIAAYVRGSSQQLLWQSYYLLEETLQYEKPKVVVFNVNAMRYGQPVKEAYNRLTLDYMRLSSAKLKMIYASKMEEENVLSYFFPILRYHSRIYELTEEDFTYFFTRRENTYLGHLVNTEVVPVTTLPTVKKLADYRFDDICYDYLNRMVQLCQKEGVELVLMKAPSLYPHWYEEYDKQIVDFAKENGLKYYNFIEVKDEIGIDYQTDTYDAGIHLNEAGAMKLSSYFADILKRDFDLNDYRDDQKCVAVYQQLLERYNNEVE